MSSTSLTGSGIIRRKVLPPQLPAAIIPRARLDSIIGKLAARHAVTVIAAPPGSGKTTAVGHAMLAMDWPVAWLGVDQTDVAPGRLVTYLGMALDRVASGAAEVVASALAAGIPHPEVAGIVAEAITEPTVLVLDDLERLGDEQAAWAVIETFVRYAPDHAHTLLLSRRSIPPSLCVLPDGRRTAMLRRETLAFTVGEAREALAGAPGVDAARVVAASGGWVAGVLFESELGDARVADDDDPLHGHLSWQILEQLNGDAREFLVTTSLLDEVDAAGAAALGAIDAAARLTALRQAHLPVTWSPGGEAMRCHPRFREFLLERLNQRDPQALRALRLRHADLLTEAGNAEEATEEYLRAGDHQRARLVAEAAIFNVIDRLDFAVAERWMSVLYSGGEGSSTTLDVAELMLAIACGDFRRGVRVGDRLAAAGRRDALAADSEQAAVLMAWCYAGVWRWRDRDAVVAVAAPSSKMDALLYSDRLIAKHSARQRPELCGGPTDALVLSTDLVLGRLGELTATPTSRWLDAVSMPWRIAALRASGRTQEAFALYEQAMRVGVAEAHLVSTVAPELFMDLGQHDQALAAIERGRKLVAKNGATWEWLLTWFAEAKLRLRVDRDVEGAVAALDTIQREVHSKGLEAEYVTEMLDMWRGLACLIADDATAAAEHLERATAGMRAGGRLLDLPIAAVYLSEARWRLDDERGADAAADIALEAADRQGSTHQMLQALSDFPAVASRRIDALADRASRWYEIGRSLFALRRPSVTTAEATVELREFGRPVLLVAGEPKRPRIAKAYELLALLLTRPERSWPRRDLLDALFDGRDDPSTRAYLRQAINQLRQLMPDADAILIDDGTVGLSEDLRVTHDSARAESLLEEGRVRHGNARLQVLLDALGLLDGGEFLEGAASVWVDDERRRFAGLAVDARHDAAELLFAAARYGDAHRLVEAVLREDPLREGAWRLKMRIADMLGDADGVLAAFQACANALARIDVAPSATTRELLTRLRR